MNLSPSPSVRPGPLSLTQAQQLLGRLLVPSTAAALLVVTPFDTVPGVDVRLVDGSWVWRGRSVEIGDDPLAALVELVARCAHPSDRFVDPSTAPWQWLRPVRSGVAVHAVGFDLLLGGPAVRCDPTVPSWAVFELGRRFLLGDVDAPCVVDVDGLSLFVSGDDQAWSVSTLDTAATLDRQLEQVSVADVLTLAGHLGRDLGTNVHVHGGLDGTPSGEFRCTVGRLAVRVPFTVSGSVVVAGVHKVDDVPPAVDWLPDTWVSTGVVGPDVCAVTAHGWWLLVRPT